MPFVALAIGVVIVVIDQVIKLMISNGLGSGGTISVIDGIFKLVYLENRGVAFGMFRDMRWFLVALTTAMIGLIIVYMFWKKPKGKLFYICAGLIVGGGIGNLIDRVLYGYVIDYLSLSFFPPVCNFADYCITVGVILLVVYLLFFTGKSKRKLKESVDE